MNTGGTERPESLSKEMRRDRATVTLKGQQNSAFQGRSDCLWKGCDCGCHARNKLSEAVT